MKTIIFISFFIGMGLIYGCAKGIETGSTSCVISQIPKDKLVDYANKVSLDTAIMDVYTYATVADSLFKLGGGTADSVIRAYTIGKADLLGVLGMSVPANCPIRYDNCRVYIGLRRQIKKIVIKEKVPDTTFFYTYKLYMTPIDSNGRDVFYNTKSSIAAAATKDSYVLDLIAPCPKTCDASSPLYNFKMP